MRYFFGKIVSSLLLMLVVISPLQSQILQPVTWSFNHESKGNNRHELQFTATIDEGWYIYGTDLPPNGPIPTGFEFAPNSGFRLIGGLKMPKPVIKFDPNFNMDLALYSQSVTFSQIVEIISSQPVKVEGQLVFMSCNATMCLPPDFIDFEFNLPAKAPLASLLVNINESSTPPHQAISDSIYGVDSQDVSNNINVSEAVLPPTQSQEQGSIWGVILTGLLGGLMALLTPCVFPMIPLTVSFFLRNAGNRSRAIRDALIYGITIIFSYVVIGLAVSMLFGPDTLNALATSPGFNLFFFALLVIFAVSFLGAFELTLPSSWTNALDAKADKSGGIIGTVLMGFTFVLVSFSCTGPIVGTLLVDAATGGNVLGPAAGMLGFSLALAIPFTLFAIFPTALKSLPKSGGWMNVIKVVLGFIVLAFSLKFFAVADAVGLWGIMGRDAFIAIWIAIFLILGLYLLGKIKFAHDSDTENLSVPRLVLAIATFAFVFYLLPGLWGAPLKAVSSFLPSAATQSFNIGNESLQSGDTSTSRIYTGPNVKEGPHGLMSFTDFEEGMAAARKAGKPVFLNFTGHGCANCRKMEAHVWSHPEVRNRLANDFVKISLYVDDRTPLPAEQQFVSTALGRERTIRNIGQKWSVFQAERYGINTQPYYVIIDHDENTIAPPHAYDLNIERFVEFLEIGKLNFVK